MLGLPTWAVFVGVFGVAFAATWLLTPATAWASRRLGIVGPLESNGSREVLVPPPPED